ncbi:response regulator [Aeromonas hydrophila]
MLVVDDHIANRVLMERQLMYIGYNVLTASDGVEALDIYNREIIDLIITDCQMPRMDGYELTRKIRQKECNTESHPIGIFGLTASAMQNDFDRCIESGMDDCLFKPFKLNVMSEKYINISRLFILKLRLLTILQIGVSFIMTSLLNVINPTLRTLQNA